MFHLYLVLLLARTGTNTIISLPFLLPKHLACVHLDPTLNQRGRFPNFFNFLAMALISQHEVEVGVEIWQNGVSGVHAYY